MQINLGIKHATERARPRFPSMGTGEIPRNIYSVLTMVRTLLQNLKINLPTEESMHVKYNTPAWTVVPDRTEANQLIDPAVIS